MVYSWNPSTWETEAERSKFKAILFFMRPYLKNSQGAGGVGWGGVSQYSGVKCRYMSKFKASQDYIVRPYTQQGGGRDTEGVVPQFGNPSTREPKLRGLPWIPVAWPALPCPTQWVLNQTARVRHCLKNQRASALVSPFSSRRNYVSLSTWQSGHYKLNL